MLTDPATLFMSLLAVVSVCYGVDKIRQSRKNRLYENHLSTPRCHCAAKLQDRTRSARRRH